MSEKEPWIGAFEELDQTLVEVDRTASHAFWPVVALAAALIETGVLRKNALLEMTEAVDDMAATYAEPGYVEEDLHALRQFRGTIEALPLGPGRALEEIRIQASMSALVNLVRRRPRKASGPEDPDQK